jgi:hypothetical protein
MALDKIRDRIPDADHENRRGRRIVRQRLDRVCHQPGNLPGWQTVELVQGDDEVATLSHLSEDLLHQTGCDYLILQSSTKTWESLLALGCKPIDAVGFEMVIEERTFRQSAE